MYLVFDIGGTFVKYAWMSEDGEIHEKNKIPTRNRVGETLDDFIDSLVEIYEQYKDKYEVQGIAMGLPGQIDVENGIVYGGGGLKYLHACHLGEVISKRCDNVPVSLENDGKCAALAEVWKGNAVGCKDACVLVFGTGIGGGIIVDGHVHHGMDMMAGEISFCFDHVTREDLPNFQAIEDMKTLEDEYKYLPYMWSTMNSTRGFCYRVAVAKGLTPDEVDGELIYKWAEAGDKEVQEMLEEYYFDIAKYCCNLFVTISPEIILLGGGISAQPAFLEGVRKYVNQLKRISNVFNKINVDVCKHRGDSNLLGAMYNFKQKYNLN